MWKTGFPFLEKRPASISGWKRRFWQGSTDHRGHPGAPGRVVTIVPSQQATCWGIAYALAPHSKAKILSDLDHREKGGYLQIEIELTFEDGSEGKGITYLAAPGNKNYLGPATIEQIAQQIAQSSGPSGTNIEYLRKVAASLESMDVQEKHIASLVSHLEMH